MTVLDMAIKYYPQLWDINRINQLLNAGRITQSEYQQIVGSKTVN